MGGPLEWLVTQLVRKRLKDLLQNFTTANLELELRSGRLLLHDVSLSPAALSELLSGLPVSEARVGRLEVLLPWRTSPPGPLVLELDGVRLVLGPHAPSGLDGAACAGAATR